MKTTYLIALAALAAGACSSTPTIPNASGLQSIEIDPGTRGPIAGVGIESQDIIAMTDQMMRDMLSTPALAGRATPPRIILDAEYFRNESSQRINKNAITDRLRVNLNRSAGGRMSFLGREYAGMVEQERQLKRDGATDVGTTGMTRAQAGADFRLGGRIVSVDQAQPRTGMIQRYNQITFEMIDLESGMIVWSGQYEFARAAADDVIYR